MGLTRRAVLGASASASLAAAGCLGSARSGSRSCPATVPGDVDARLGFTGDVMLGRGVDRHWSGKPPAGVWGSTLERLRSLDGLFVNLECCVSNRGTRRPGRTYYFRASPDWAIPALSTAGVTWASLANNHVLDYGPDALADTADHLTAAGIGHAGAGTTLRAAIRPSVVDAGGLDVGVLAFTDRSRTYAAGRSDPGSAFVRFETGNPRTRGLIGRALRTLRASEPDLVVASLHWGPNWKTRPSRDRRRFARWLVDRGVDVVHGHSAHVVQGIEVYRGRPIIYDAGDFVDDYAVKPGLHNDRSFLFEVAVADGRLEAIRLLPVEIRDETVHRAGSDVAEWLRARMRSLCSAFGTPLRRAGEGLRVPLATC